jgi:hypothetical protein
MKIATETANFIGLIHGLMPVTVRESNGAAASAASSSATLIQPIVESRGLRRCSSAKKFLPNSSTRITRNLPRRIDA